MLYTNYLLEFLYSINIFIEIFLFTSDFGGERLVLFLLVVIV